jgi:hypothetical protein
MLRDRYGCGDHLTRHRPTGSRNILMFIIALCTMTGAWHLLCSQINIKTCRYI